MKKEYMRKVIKKYRNLVRSGKRQGIVYLLKPAEHLDTDHFKIGFSRLPNLDRVLKGYRKGTEIIMVRKCYKPREKEDYIKYRFEKYQYKGGGREYIKGKKEDIYYDFIIDSTEITHPLQGFWNLFDKTNKKEDLIPLKELYEYYKTWNDILSSVEDREEILDLNQFEIVIQREKGLIKNNRDIYCKGVKWDDDKWKAFEEENDYFV